MKTIKDYDLNNKKVIIRCDFNVPIQNGVITDDTRIKESLPTIKYAVDNNAKVILLSHLGRIKEEKDKQNNSLLPVKERLSQLLGMEVIFSKYTHGDTLNNLVLALKPKDILLVENTRYEDLDNKKESTCNDELSKYWASLGDIFINDAYGTLHRAHASNVGIAKYLPSGIGFLVENELTKINDFLKEDTHPYILIMGGKKVSDKITLIENLINKCDKLLIGGAMAFTFLNALGYDTKDNIVDKENLTFCKNILNKYPSNIILPVDFINEKGENIPLNRLNKDIALDIGASTVELFQKELSNAKRVIINGPMGMFEDKRYQNGTKKLYTYLYENNIKTLIGGGDTAASANILGFKDKFYHISTGGGATLEYLEGKPLEGLNVISHE